MQSGRRAAIPSLSTRCRSPSSRSNRGSAASSVIGRIAGFWPCWIRASERKATAAGSSIRCRPRRSSAISRTWRPFFPPERPSISRWAASMIPAPNARNARNGSVIHGLRGLSSVVVALAVSTAGVTVRGENDAPALRLHGLVEPVRSHPVVVPRLAGAGPGTLVVIHLVKPGTRVRRGDLLIEFDRQAQIKTAHDRQAEYQDFVEQINRKRGEQLTARAHGETELKIAENAVRSAELEVQKKEVVAAITAEQNQLTLDEAHAKVAQLRRTFELRHK